MADVLRVRGSSAMSLQSLWTDSKGEEGTACNERSMLRQTSDAVRVVMENVLKSHGRNVVECEGHLARREQMFLGPA